MGIPKLKCKRLFKVRERKLYYFIRERENPEGSGPLKEERQKVYYDLEKMSA